MILRPKAVFVEGEFRQGLEVELDDSGVVCAIRTSTKPSDPWLLSPAFVNAHSHLEYRGLQGKIPLGDYFEFIRAITQLKLSQPLEQVQSDADLGATENANTGVALIGEHSDRPVAGAAMRKAGLEGRIFQELITFNEREAPAEKIALVRENARINSEAFGGPVDISPHAFQTVDPNTLHALFGAGRGPFSMHVGETVDESRMTRRGEGPLADFHRLNGFPPPMSGKRLIPTLDDLGLVRPGAQFVHLCDIDDSEIELLSRSGVTAAHCPRSNAALNCPMSPVRRMLDAKIPVGLGLDSAASSGPIDMFDEMRAALAASVERNEPLQADQIWRMATELGAASLGIESWTLAVGNRIPLIAIELPDATNSSQAIAHGTPDTVRWIVRPQAP